MDNAPDHNKLPDGMKESISRAMQKQRDEMATESPLDKVFGAKEKEGAELVGKIGYFAPPPAGGRKIGEDAIGRIGDAVPATPFDAAELPPERSRPGAVYDMGPPEKAAQGDPEAEEGPWPDYGNGEAKGEAEGGPWAEGRWEFARIGEAKIDTRTGGGNPVAAEVLQAAAGAVTKDRRETYGPAENSFQVIADGWNWLLVSKGILDGPKITALDVADLMEVLKIARSFSSPSHIDNYVDRAGYAALAAQIVSDDEKS